MLDLLEIQKKINFVFGFIASSNFVRSDISTNENSIPNGTN